jgi:sulfoxide reductase heme-binding subunit YedZ
LLTYLLLDQQLWWDAIIKDITKRPYIIIGVVAFVLMTPLALTSNNWSLRKWGPQVWRKLHKLTYVTAIAGGLHYVMLKKTWQVEPLLYLLVLVALVAYRYLKPLNARFRAQA